MGAREISLSGPFFDTSFVSSLYSFHTRFAAIGAPPPELLALAVGLSAAGGGAGLSRKGRRAGRPSGAPAVG